MRPHLVKEQVTLLVIALLLATWTLAVFQVSTAFAGCSGDDWMCNPPPPPTPAPPPPSGGAITSITESVTNVFHHLVFPVQTISDALLKIFKGALNKEQRAVIGQEQDWISAFSSLFQAPPAGAYTSVANAGLKVAAGIAAALFILRLAIYNWNRLLGEDDDAVHVIGDWLTAGLLALVAGPLLDLINRIGWWIMSVVLGSASGLAKTFADGLLNASWDSSLANTTFIGPIIMIALMIASMLAVIGIIVAFASGHAVMYVLAAVGPAAMVAGVIPKMRWLRGMWFQATVVVAFLPVVAAAVFKAGIEAAAHVSGGVAQEIFRILWLFGVTGFLLSITGILSKFSIGAAGDTIGRLARIGKGIIESAVLAGGALATGGAGAAGVGALATAGATLGGGGGAGALALGVGEAATAGGASAIGGFSASAQGAQNSQNALGNADIASGLGLGKVTSQYQRQTMGEQIAARQADLDSRMQQAVPADTINATSNFGYTPTVNTALSNHYSDPDGVKVFNEGLQGLSPHISGGLLDSSVTPNSLMLHHTDDMIRMIDAWNASPAFAKADNPLWAAMHAANVSDDFKSLFKGS